MVYLFTGGSHSQLTRTHSSSPLYVVSHGPVVGFVPVKVATQTTQGALQGARDSNLDHLDAIPQDEDAIGKCHSLRMWLSNIHGMHCHHQSYYFFINWFRSTGICAL